MGYDPSAHVEHVAGQWENEHHNTHHDSTGQEHHNTHHDSTDQEHHNTHHDSTGQEHHKFGEDESCALDSDCKSGLQCNTPCSWNYDMTPPGTEKCCGPSW